MSDERVRIGMTPPHPGSFIRTEILDELGLSVSRAADILGVRRATLSDLVNGKASLSPGNGAQDREGVRRVHGHALAHGSVVRLSCDAPPCRRDQRQTLPVCLATEDGAANRPTSIDTDPCELSSVR